jgi:pyruvate/2-oxoglutarate/acetoin dehydrogenase E1 component
VPVSDSDYVVPIGTAATVREGSDVTIAAWGLGVHQAVECADLAMKEGIDVEVLDLRTLAPLDRDSILQSVQKTGRLVVVDDDYRSCGLAAEIIATVCESGRSTLKAPPCRITFPDIPIPFAPQMERPLLPSTGKLVEAVRAQMVSHS